MESVATLITDPRQFDGRNFKYLTYIAMGWIAFLITAMMVATKIINLGGFNFSVAVLVYPVTYIFCNIFTEVYGYAVTRRIVWTGFFLLALVSAAIYLMIQIPPSDIYADNEAFVVIFSASPLISLAAILAFFAGELTNSFVLAKMKLLTKGRYLWTRTISSTFFGQTVDNFVFYFVAFIPLGLYSPQQLVVLWLSTVILCVLYEIMATPITYKVVHFLKHAEGIDAYDAQTHFNPLRLSLFFPHPSKES